MRGYDLVIRFADTHTNEFLELGGASWRTRREQIEAWNIVPATSGRTCVLLDRHAANGDLEDTRFINGKTACALLGERLGVMIERARAALGHGTPNI